MVSDSLTYVYSSHEWQQARATTSFGQDYIFELADCKALASEVKNCSVRIRCDSSLSDSAQRIIIIHCCGTAGTGNETAIGDGHQPVQAPRRLHCTAQT